MNEPQASSRAVRPQRPDRVPVDIVSAIAGVPHTAANASPLACERSALMLYASLLDTDVLAVGAHRLAAALAADGGFERVSIGLHEAGRTRLIATSHLDLAQLPVELEPALLGAMDEALEQGLTLACPAADEGGDPLLVEHRLLQRLVGGAVATVPLGTAGRPLAAVCVERRGASPDAGFSADELQRLERLLVLAAPALRWMHAGTEPGLRRLRRDLLRGLAALRQPERRASRHWLLGAAVMVTLAAIVPLEDPVAGRARIEGAEQRVMAAPTDGFIKTAHVRPGDQVRAGAPLVDLLEADLRLEADRWTSQLAQHENAYAAAMGRSDRVAASTSIARVSEAQAQLALVTEQLARGRIVAPFDGQVIQGDLSQQIGAPVRQGDALLTLAKSGRHRVIVEVDEVDIARVQAGQQGRLALSSLPWDREDLVVERIAPLARAVDGRNVFEVEAHLLGTRAELRPGLLGRADIVSGRAPLLWGWTRHALLRLRVALWAWLA